VDAVALRIIAGEHYPLTIWEYLTRQRADRSVHLRSVEKAAPEDLGWIDIILNGQI
jgi:hypothetical protein